MTTTKSESRHEHAPESYERYLDPRIHDEGERVRSARRQHAIDLAAYILDLEKKLAEARFQLLSVQIVLCATR
jgi:hypothetical protein